MTKNENPEIKRKEEGKEKEKISVFEKIGFGLGDTASNLFFQTFMLFLLYFYTDVFGIPAAVAGTMFLVTRIWDSVNDPIMGIIADRTETRWGKFRPYLLWMSVPFGIIGVLTFTTPDLSLQGKIIYAYVTYGLMMMVYTAINIPYSALMGVVSSDPLERTSFSQYRFIFAFLGAFLVQGLTLPLVNSFGGDNTDVISASVENHRIVLAEEGVGTSKLIISAGGNKSDSLTEKIVVNVYRPEYASEIDTTTDILYFRKGFGKYELDPQKYFDVNIAAFPLSVEIVNEAKGFQWTMTVFAVAAVIMFLITFASTKERVRPPKEQKTNLKNDVKDLLTNIPWVILFFIGIFSLSYISIRNGAIIYYFKYFVGDELAATGFMLAGTIVTIVAIMMTEWLSKKFGKKKVFMGAMFFSTLFSAAFFFLDKDDIMLMYVFQILGSFAAGPTAPIVFAMYTDCADYSEWRNGRRATGLVMSASTMAQKFGWTIGGALAGWLLAIFGFKANVVQSAESVYGIVLMMSLIPAIGSFIAGSMMYFYKLDDEFMYKIERDLNARRGDVLEAEL
jgi:GPH family glycoside/pentoside/hexuronide:cation symporter